MNDDRLLERAAALDDTALAAIFDRYYEPLYRYAFHHLGNIEAAEDVANRVFQRLLHDLHRGRGPTQALKPWLYRVAANLVVDDVRRQRLRNHAPLADDLPHDGPPVEDDVAQRMLARQARRALDALTAQQRDVLILRYLHDLELSEVADILETTVGAVKALQHRGLAALRRRLEALEAEEPTE